MEKSPGTSLKDRFWTQAARTDVLYSLGTAVVGTGLLTWVAQRWTEVTGGSWPASIFVGLGATCVLVLVACAFMVSLRIFKPLESKSQTQDKSGVSDSTASMMFKLNQQLDNAIGGFESQLEREIPAINVKISDLTTTMVKLAADSDARQSKLEREIEGKITSVNASIVSSGNAVRTEVHMLAEKVFVLKAVHELRQWAREIERLTLLLERPLKQPKEQRDWAAWPPRFLKYKRAVQLYANLCSSFFPKESTVLITEDPSIYRINEGDFAASNFPNHQIAHDFKTFRKMSDSYRSLGPTLLDHIESKA